MDAHNLSIVFAPTIFRSNVTDPIRAVMEVKLSQVLLEQIIVRHNLLYHAIQGFMEHALQSRTSSAPRQAMSAASPPSMGHGPAMSAASSDSSHDQRTVALQEILKNPILPSYPLVAMEIADRETCGLDQCSGEELAEIGDIASNINTKMMGRMADRHRGGRRSTPRRGDGAEGEEEEARPSAEELLKLDIDVEVDGHRFSDDNVDEYGPPHRLRREHSEDNVLDDLESDLMERASFIIETNR